MAITLTPEQVDELERSDGSPPQVQNPRNHRGYVLVPSESYEQHRPIFDALIEDTRASLGQTAQAPTVPVVWNDQKNTRRCALIDKKHNDGLTAQETTELLRLQSELEGYQRQVAPRPLAILELMEDGLRHRAASTSQKK
jgi:hypothetical protein